MVDLSLFLQITALHIFHAALAACFLLSLSLSPCKQLLCACVSEIYKNVLIQYIYYMFLLEGSVVVYGSSWQHAILFR
jgi:hypothetical protein